MDKKQPRLENWTVTVHNGRPCMQGQVYDHPNPRHHDGKEIKTSPIDVAQGNLVHCSNRSYELGTVDAEFAGKCAESDIVFDVARPADAINAIVERLDPDRPVVN